MEEIFSPLFFPPNFWYILFATIVVRFGFHAILLTLLMLKCLWSKSTKATVGGQGGCPPWPQLLIRPGVAPRT